MELLSLLATTALTQNCQRSGFFASLLLASEQMTRITPVADLEPDTNSDAHSELDVNVDINVNLNENVEVETQQFSPTGFLEGEVIFGVSGITGGEVSDPIVFQESAELILNISFTGEDLLQVGIESGNGIPFSFVDELTFEGRLSFPSETEDHHIELSELSYAFPIGDRTSVYISTAGNDLNDFNPLLSGSSDGAISEFGTENPINSLVGDVGLQLTYDLSDASSISAGYFSNASDPEAGTGLFNGNQSTFIQFQFEPSDRLLLGLTYIHTYDKFDLATETGSLRSQINLERPVIGNSYGIAGSVSPSASFTLGGWLGMTKARVIELGDADVWNYALTLTFPNLGGDNNLLGLVIGQEPRLTGTSGFRIDDRRSDPNTSLHIEVFYRQVLSDHLAVTPGLIWITAPNYDHNNPDILIFTVRTAFEF